MSLVVGDKDLEKIVRKIIEYHSAAIGGSFIQKPWAWALYQTWKYVDAKEKPRQPEKKESGE